MCTSSKESGAGVCTLEDSGAGACTSKERGDGVCTSSKESGAGACTSKERGDGVCTSSKESGAGVCTSKERGNGVCTSKESGVGACTSKERGAGVCSNLTSDICKELLCGSPITEEKDDDSKESAISLDFLTGYPRSPLYERLAQSMYYWIVTGYVNGSLISATSGNSCEDRVVFILGSSYLCTHGSTSRGHTNSSKRAT